MVTLRIKTFIIIFSLVFLLGAHITSSVEVRTQELPDSGRLSGPISDISPIISSPDGNNQEVDDLIKIGNDLQAQGKLEDAIIIFDKAIDGDQNNAVAWNNKGTALLGLGKFDDAIDAFNEAVAINSEYIDALMNKGVLLNYLGRSDEAIEAFDQVLAIDPSHENAINGKSLAESQLEGNYPAVSPTPKDSVNSNINQDNSKDDNTLSDYGDSSGEIEKYTKRIETNPQDTVSWLNLKLTYCKMGKYDEALSAMDQAIDKNPNADWAYQIKGDVLVDLKKYDEAMDLYNEAMSLDPNNINNIASKGNLLEIQGENSAAIDLYNEYADSNPNNEQIHAIKGNLLWDTGKVDEAIEEYKEAIEKNPNYTYALDKLQELKEMGYDVDIDPTPTDTPVPTATVTRSPTPKVTQTPSTSIPSNVNLYDYCCGALQRCHGDLDCWHAAGCKMGMVDLTMPPCEW